jgi:hypothetical protein
MVAHGASRGNLCMEIGKPREGRKKNYQGVFFRRFAALLYSGLLPTAHAVGYHLPPLRG